MQYSDSIGPQILQGIPIALASTHKVYADIRNGEHNPTAASRSFFEDGAYVHFPKFTCQMDCKHFYMAFIFASCDNKIVGEVIDTAHIEYDYVGCESFGRAFRDQPCTIEGAAFGCGCVYNCFRFLHRNSIHGIKSV